MERKLKGDISAYEIELDLSLLNISAPSQADLSKFNSINSDSLKV